MLKRHRNPRSCPASCSVSLQFPETDKSTNGTGDRKTSRFPAIKSSASSRCPALSVWSPTGRRPGPLCHAAADAHARVSVESRIAGSTGPYVHALAESSMERRPWISRPLPAIGWFVTQTSALFTDSPGARMDITRKAHIEYPERSRDAIGRPPSRPLPLLPHRVIVP